MIALFISLALTAAATTAAVPTVSAPETPRLLVMNLETANISAAEGRAIDAFVLAGARTDSVVTVSQTELQQLAALDAAAQGAGCETSSCLAELAGAFGARYVLFGTSSRLGSTSTVSLAVLDASTGRTVRDTISVDNIDALPQRVPAVVRALISQALTGVESSTARNDTSWTPLAGAGAGVVGLGSVVALAGLGVAAWSEFVIIRDPAASAADKLDAQSRGVTALAVAGIGVVVAAVGGTLCVVGGAQ